MGENREKTGLSTIIYFMEAEPCSLGRDNPCLMKAKRNMESKENVTVDIPYIQIYTDTLTHTRFYLYFHFYDTICTPYAFILKS